MDERPLTVRRADRHDHDVIVGLIDAAAGWLRTKNSDQWAQPWRSEEDRRHRILHDLTAGNTWIAWGDDTPAATLTTDPAQNRVWPAVSRDEPAVYVTRMVVSRAFAGRGLGAALLDWAGLRARRRYGARWVRVDVWTTNAALHAYYRRLGFEFYGLREESAGYPSAALFQKATEGIRPAVDTLFRQQPRADG